MVEGKSYGSLESFFHCGERECMESESHCGERECMESESPL
jgi:hypothetical protein